MRKWRKKYEVAEYIKDAMRQMKPPEDITVSEWAEKYRMLDSKSTAMPGPWRNSKSPYLVEIMDELNNYETEEIVFCKCTQIGGTEAELNMMGYVISQDPAPSMVVYPTDTLGESVSKNRIRPMIKASHQLNERFYELRSLTLEMQFDGMYLTISGANSPASLASKAIKYLFLDEVDKYPGASKKEADPISLARERTKTFANRKIYITSTPTIKSGHIWKNLLDCDVEKHYFVPCPHCGEMIELKFANLQFPEKTEDMTASDRADQAVYACQECGCAIGDHNKAEMLRRGRWEIVKENNSARRKIGYWIPVLYSPFVRFSEIALEWINSQGDNDRLQNFVNSWLAEPWEDTRLTTSKDIVLERQTEFEEFEVPSWAKFLTGGVDVQENCMYWTIRAWGNHITSQCICHAQALSWQDIERVMNYSYHKATGEQLVVAMCLIDSGFDTDAVYDFCANNSDWALPVKGSSRRMTEHYHLSKINKNGSRAYGMNLCVVDGDKYKDMIAARMKKENGRGAWMVYKGCDQEYAKQVTSEHKVSAKKGAYTIEKWEVKSSHSDNHYLDTEVYAFAAADIMGVRSMHLLEEEQQQEKAQRPERQETPEESWISANEDWI